MGNAAAVSMVLEGLVLYAALGALFAVAFLVAGVTRVDPGARSAGFAFRLAILPGLIALWPLMLVRWIAGGAPHGGGSDRG